MWQTEDTRSKPWNISMCMAASRKFYEATNGNVVPVQRRVKKKIQLRNRQHRTLTAVTDQPTENEPVQGPQLIARLEMAV
jgi:hypothetical protein